MNIKLSIVTVSYNDYVGLVRTEKSISDNLELIHEWIVIDGGSGKAVEDFLQSSDTVTVYRSERDAGIYDAMNKGSALATGDYVLYLNSGDTLCKGVDWRAFSNVDRNSGLIFLGANVFANNSIVRYKKPLSKERLKHSLPTSHQAILFPISFVKNQEYDLSYRICGDYYYVAKYFEKLEKYTIIDTPFSNFELGGVSTYSPLKLCAEAERIQRDLLRISYLYRKLSYIRRIMSLSLMFFLYKVRG